MYTVMATSHTNTKKLYGNEEVRRRDIVICHVNLASTCAEFRVHGGFKFNV